jgi:hypothetical protein
MLGALTAAAATGSPGAPQRRAALLSLDLAQPANAPRLAAALRDTDPLVRRTAARLLGTLQPPRPDLLTHGLASPDVLVRRIVALGLGHSGPAGLPGLRQALSDKDPFVRAGAVTALAQLRPRQEAIVGFLTTAGQDPEMMVREAALLAGQHYFTVLEEIPLPASGWKFRPDPETLGEKQGWHRPELAEAGWSDIGIGKFWQDFGFQTVGYAWYRLTWQLPARPAPPRVEMHFGAVDEVARMWLNGELVGEHDIGPMGWDKPFALDVTRHLRWGQDNQVTVRVHNSAQAGGIWQPVTLRLMALIP